MSACFQQCYNTNVMFEQKYSFVSFKSASIATPHYFKGKANSRGLFQREIILDNLLHKYKQSFILWHSSYSPW